MRNSEYLFGGRVERWFRIAQVIVHTFSSCCCRSARVALSASLSRSICPARSRHVSVSFVSPTRNRKKNKDRVICWVRLRVNFARLGQISKNTPRNYLRDVSGAQFAPPTHSVVPLVLVVDTLLSLLPTLLALLGRWLTPIEVPLALVLFVSMRYPFHPPMPEVRDKTGC